MEGSGDGIIGRAVGPICKLEGVQGGGEDRLDFLIYIYIYLVFFRDSTLSQPTQSLPQHSPDHNHQITDHSHLQSSISTPTNTRSSQCLIV